MVILCRFAYLPSDEDGDNDENVEQQVVSKTKAQQASAKSQTAATKGAVKGGSVVTSGADSKSKAVAGTTTGVGAQKKAQTQGNVAGAPVPSGKNTSARGASGSVPTSARSGPFRPNSSGSNNNQNAGTEQNYRNDDGGNGKLSSGLLVSDIFLLSLAHIR